MSNDGIYLRDVSFGYGALRVLESQSFVVPPGGCALVTGENGVGKSTLLYIAAGLLPVEKGSVRLAGQAPEALAPSALLRAGVRRGFLFQNGGLLSNLSALANVTLALRYHADLLGLDEEAVERRAKQSLEEVEVDAGDWKALPAHLSFGVRRRVALARALALQPNFFFFDDPDSGLDPRTAALVHSILVRFRDDPAVTMMVASNQGALIEKLESQAWELHEGKLRAQG